LRLSRVSDLSQRLMSLLAGYGDGAAKRNGNGEATGDGAAGPPRYLTRLAIKDIGRVVFLDVSEIDWIEAADYYVQIHAGGKSYLHRETMQRLAAELDSDRFVRIHRSAIVNRSRIKELRNQGRREAVVVLANGAVLRVARSHRDKLQKLR